MSHVPFEIKVERWSKVARQKITEWLSSYIVHCLSPETTRQTSQLSELLVPRHGPKPGWVTRKHEIQSEPLNTCRLIRHRIWNMTGQLQIIPDWRTVNYWAHTEPSHIRHHKGKMQRSTLTTMTSTLYITEKRTNNLGGGGINENSQEFTKSLILL